MNNNSIKLNYYFDQLMHALMHVGPAKAQTLLTEVSLQELNIIYFLGQNPGKIQREIATQLALSASNTSIVVNKLVKKELAHRLSSEQDRRIIRLELTAKGRTAYQKMLDSHLKISDYILSRLTSAEQGQLLQLLEKAIGRSPEKHGS